MRICNKCGINPVRAPKQYNCAECHREYMRGRYKTDSDAVKTRVKERKVEIRNLIKEAKNVPCVDCHETYPWYCMDFDHLRDKKFNLSVAAQKAWALDTIRAEIEKCDVVCANCHRKRTFERTQ